jgi:endonuclease/exonuclease/phosphatase family metal-dependent hydrolase
MMSYILPFLIAAVLSGCLAPQTNTETAGARDPAGQPDVMTVTSWNAKHMGRSIFPVAEISPLFADADIAVFQEVDTKNNGWNALLQIVRQLQTLLPAEHFCTGLSEIPKGASERYAYIWKNSRISYVKTNGEIIRDCGDTAVTIRLNPRNAEDMTRPPSLGTFFFKPAGKNFVLASIHMPPAKKRPADQVPALFDSFSEIKQPVIVAGDYNLPASDPIFSEGVDNGFKPALNSPLTSLKQNKRELNKAYDNFWYRGLQAVNLPNGKTNVLNLYQIFPEKDQKEIYDNFSDHCPITAQFKF